MDNQFSIEEVQALQKWADSLYSVVMDCLDRYDHAEDCYLYRVPDDPDAKWGQGCDCWRSRLKAIAQQYMVKPESKND